MAAAPWFVVGPSLCLGALGLRRGPDPVVPTPAEDWRQARVDVVIAADGDQHRIVHCLAALQQQSLAPRRILLVDDAGGERDHTAQLAREFANANGLQLEIIVRHWRVGKVVTIKRQAREFDGDVVFVLDAGTVLESPAYIERCVRELYQGVGIASACGVLLPLRTAHREAVAASPGFQRWLAGDGYRDPLQPVGWPHRAWRWLGDSHGECAARVEQELLNRGLMQRYGGIDRPFGGAVAYRRGYLKDLFDRYEPIRGDDLCEVEDFFIGRALNSAGYRNLQLADIVARAQVAEPHELLRRSHRWSVSLLQGGYHFDALLRTPWRRLLARWRKREPQSRRPAEARVIREAYRQPFGERITQLQGRPIGTAMLVSAGERIGYPLLLVLLPALGYWSALVVVVAGEATLAIVLAGWLAPPQRRREALLQAVVSTPVRYALIVAEWFTLLRFAAQVWFTGRRRWFLRRAPHQRSWSGG